jgi:hypothetical protein
VAKAKPAERSSYEIMGSRIVALINSPAAQKSQKVTVTREPYELQSDWDRFIEEISTTGDVSVTCPDADTVSLAWLADTETDA